LNNFKNLKIDAHINLSKFTTLKIGGVTEWFAEPKDIDNLKKLVSWANNKNIAYRVIGAGSNLLINDVNELSGLCMTTRKLQGAIIDADKGTIKAMSGESLPRLARKAAKAGLHGLEWAIGIPGTVGGAVVMNAGAQGGCVAERIISVEVIPMNGGNPFSLLKKELEFSYRNSIFQKEDLMILSAFFQLERGHSKEEIVELTNANLDKRTSTQPYHLPSCGSVFRNPEPLKAGQIIESLGLKGTRIGGAEISKMHANFIVNHSNATASDIKQLIFLIQKKVKDQYGFLLHPEVKELGF
tara:strand:+ start:380 stop:1273 length:894 start_codon:yes stop_codon:yes gene_type:complete